MLVKNLQRCRGGSESCLKTNISTKKKTDIHLYSLNTNKGEKITQNENIFKVIKN